MSKKRMTESKPEKGKKKATKGNALRENLEAFVIAIIFALVLRYFCVEAFKIPTSSMQPTLIGDKRTGDRILVNKFIYHLREPRRGEVIVFKYPLNQTRNYIKRLWGLPGETVEIKGGDIYIDGEVCRKNPSIQDALWRYVYSSEFPQNDFWSFWYPLSEKNRNLWKVEDDHLVVSAKEKTLLHFANKSYQKCPAHGEIVQSLKNDSLQSSFLFDEYKEGNNVINKDENRPTREVGDIRLILSGKVKEGTGAILCDLQYRGNSLLFQVPVQGSEKKAALLLNGLEKVQSDSIYLEPEDDFELIFANVDLTFSLEIQGKEPLRYDFSKDKEFVRTAFRPFWVRFGAENGTFAFSSLDLSRDTYYTTGEFPESFSYKTTVPENCYFALGDNSPKSKDSRLWQEITYVLKDGQRAVGDFSPAGPLDTLNPIELPDQTIFRDSYGNLFHMPKGEGIKLPPKKSAFVPRSLLLGRAILVFWPVPPFSSSFRPKLIW